MSRKITALAAFSLAAVLLAGCAAAPYRLPGTETQPLSNLAIVKSGPRAATYLASIDGKQVPHVLRPVVRWELSPGEHAVVVGLRTHPHFRADNTRLRFEALPGRTYVIQYEVKALWGRGTWRAWIEDEAGATVSMPDTNRASAIEK